MRIDGGSFRISVLWARDLTQRFPNLRRIKILQILARILVISPQGKRTKIPTAGLN